MSWTFIGRLTTVARAAVVAREAIIVTCLPPTLSYCVVNTNGREYLLACLAAIERTHPAGVEREILVLDNASGDGSAGAVRALEGDIRLIALDRRTGKAENDSTLMREANGRYCLLLNEDSELRPGAAAALIAALDADPKAAAATPRLLDSAGTPVPCAWRFPGVGTALAGALFLHRRLTVQSKGSKTRRVDWAQSSALLVRREAAVAVDYMDPAFFVYYDECDFAKRLEEAGWHSLFVPGAQAIHHDQLSTDLAKGLPRIVEFHRNRDLYMRKHHGRSAALAVRLLTAWSYAARALVATVLPDQPADVYRAHARQALLPSHGRSIRDRADEIHASPDKDAGRPK
jgi:N-acetylglucosaminyl-diphospho-decaprenol L-rhamnosyltransferase